MPWKQPPFPHSTIVAKANAGKLRRSMTDAEKTLWKHLRGDFAGAGTHFRRQVAIGSYVADFCCLRHRLIIELDGPIHDTASAKTYDSERERSLRTGGYKILRFANAEVALSLPLVLDQVRTALSASTPTPSPSPQGGGERAAFPRRDNQISGPNA